MEGVEAKLLFCKENEKDPSICTSRLVISFHSPPVRVCEDYPPAQYEARDVLERIWVGKLITYVSTGTLKEFHMLVATSPVGLVKGLSD